MSDLSRNRSAATCASVIDSVVAYLVARHSEDSGVRQLLTRLEQGYDVVSAQPQTPPHGQALTCALDEICGSTDPLLADVGKTIRQVSDALCWQVDNGDYYAPAAGVSKSYRDGNMNTILMRGDDFVAGLFLLEANVDYLDHRHQAPEFYLNLTGPTSWRFDLGAWEALPAGSVLWNEPRAVHATRTTTQPWLSFWTWLSNIDQLCEVVTD